MYIFGEKFENCAAMTYALAQDPQYADLMTVKSNTYEIVRLDGDIAGIG